MLRNPCIVLHEQPTYTIYSPVTIIKNENDSNEISKIYSNQDPVTLFLAVHDPWFESNNEQMRHMYVVTAQATNLTWYSLSDSPGLSPIRGGLQAHVIELIICISYDSGGSSLVR